MLTDGYSQKPKLACRIEIVGPKIKIAFSKLLNPTFKSIQLTENIF
jgi:hypothetical protein